MDLHDQWLYMRKTGQWRFTPPTHVVAALRSAIDQYLAEGGQPARLARYAKNCAALIGGLRRAGLATFLDDAVQAPIIVTFHAPDDPAYDFGQMYRRVRERGFILYPGKLTTVETFRVGCIGAIQPDAMRRAVDAIDEALHEMDVRNFAPR
jgi:2-aminoethylphosphonate-pyruvate transaminase